MLNRHHHTPRIFSLTSSVGTCGTNTPDEVKAVQQLIDNAGYQLATGQTLAINGRCDKTTTEAIRWYQLLINMSPNGLIQPTDTWFIQALNEANAPHWRPKHSGGH